MNIEKPIFIVGVGRSGSTVFHRIFAEHPRLAWISGRLMNRHPAHPRLAGALLRAVDLPFIGRLLRRYFRPAEAYAFWEEHCRGFSQPCRDLVRGDVTQAVKEALPRTLANVLTPTRNRLLVKITGWPRVAFLHEIFPDARFIHMSRDPRAVVSSLLQVNWWNGWLGPPAWRRGDLTREQQEEWERFDRSFVALAAIEVLILDEAMRKAREAVPPQSFTEVRYEDLCADPAGTFRRVFEWCELEWPAGFERALALHPLQSANTKWQRDLTPEQQRILDHFFGVRARA
jgi:hypothetical protein